MSAVAGQKAHAYLCTATPKCGGLVTCVGGPDATELKGTCPNCHLVNVITVESLNPSPTAYTFGAPRMVHDPSIGIPSAAGAKSAPAAASVASSADGVDRPLTYTATGGDASDAPASKPTTLKAL